MAIPRIGGAGIPLNLAAQASNIITLPAGQAYLPPAGTYYLDLGNSTDLEWFDPVLNYWRKVVAPSADGFFVTDGFNWRLSNNTGCPLGAVITTAGSAMTNGFGTVTISPNAGGSLWRSIVGGAINTTITITAGGSGFTFPPTLILSAPPAGGFQASAVCTISAGAINAVTVVNQGAGYTLAPTVTIVNDPRDTTGTGAVLTAALTGSGTLTGMVAISQGTPVTAPVTFTFNPAGAAATAIMNFAITGFAVTTAGTTYGNAQQVTLTAQGGLAVATSILVNPNHDRGLCQPFGGIIDILSTAGGAIQTAGAVTRNAGKGFHLVPGMYIAPGGAFTYAASASGQATPTVGGVTDTSWLQPM